MATARCYEGHESSGLDYCSVCGMKIDEHNESESQVWHTAPATQMFIPLAKAAVEECPMCLQPHIDTETRFCSMCRYDFVEHKPGSSLPTPANNIVEKIEPSHLQHSMHQRWLLFVELDPSLDKEASKDSPCPKGELPRAIEVDGEEMLIGRRDERHGIRPHVVLNDPGCSRKQAKISVRNGNELVIQDLASTNGTQVNGVELKGEIPRPLVEGDVITIGRWTKITVRNLV